ncbi:MAG: hypothetical protein ACJA0G_000564 [Kangiellaceae bacterium]|jgi:hypothetical protein
MTVGSLLVTAYQVAQKLIYGSYIGLIIYSGIEPIHYIFVLHYRILFAVNL